MRHLLRLSSGEAAPLGLLTFYLDPATRRGNSQGYLLTGVRE